ncbi:MAG: 3-isopropylmalate dehydrogenase [Terriglobia bacterium]
MTKTIVLLPGDGIGPEVTSAAASVLKDCATIFGHRFTLLEFPIGGSAIDRCGSPLPQETLHACRQADAILLGAVGGPRWDALPPERRPERGLLALRKELDLFINLRPVCLREPLRAISPLKPERTRKINFEIVRELAGGIYFGPHRLEVENGVEQALDMEAYSTPEIERVCRFAFARAQERNQHLTSVDKANVLATSFLWRKTVERLAASYAGVAVQHLYVDTAALQLVLAPEQFDVIVTSNLFGDILSDAAAALVGSIGLIPSMSCGSGPPLFEPIHGSAPTLAGKDCACPIGAILSSALLLREGFGLRAEAQWIEAAVELVLAQGYRTPDIADAQSIVVGCSEFVKKLHPAREELLEPLEQYGWGV